MTLVRRFVYQYPNDPPTEAIEMTGADFVALVRRGQPGCIVVDGGDEPPTVIEFDEVVCDSCNGEVLPEDVCVSVPDTARLYCAACRDEWLTPHVVGGSELVVVSVGMPLGSEQEMSCRSCGRTLGTNSRVCEECHDHQGGA